MTPWPVEDTSAFCTSSSLHVFFPETEEEDVSAWSAGFGSGNRWGFYAKPHGCERGAIPTVYPQVAAQAPHALLKYLSIFKSRHVSELLSEASLQSLLASFC